MVGSHAPGVYYDDTSLSDDPPATEKKQPVLNDTLKAFLEPARNLRRVVDLYCNIHMVFLNGNTIMEHLADEDLEYDDEACAIADLAQARNGDVHAYSGDWRIFNAILDVIPGLRDCYDNTPDMDVLLKLAKEMNERANNGRATDAHSLKEGIKMYIPDWSPSAPDIHDTKAQRGFNHVQYTKQLIPARYARLFKEDPISTRAKLLDGRLVVSPRFMPSFVYERPEDYTSNTVEDGLFCGPLLLRVARHILIGPNVSATAKVLPGGGGNANKHRITRTTPELVAYFVVQAYFAMNSTTTWNAGSSKGTAAEFDYSLLYYTVIKMFNPTIGDEVNEWAHETLQWINQQLYGHPEGMSGAAAPSQGINDDDDDWLRMIKNRAARQMARASSLRETSATLNLNTSNSSTPAATEDSEWPVPSSPPPSEVPAGLPIDPVLLAISNDLPDLPVPRPRSAEGISADTHTPPLHMPSLGVDNLSLLRATPASMVPDLSGPADSVHNTVIMPSASIDHSDRTTQPEANHPAAVDNFPGQSNGVTKRTSPSSGEGPDVENASGRPRKKTSASTGTSQGRKTRGGAPKAVAQRSTRQTTAGRNTNGK